MNRTNFTGSVAIVNYRYHTVDHTLVLRTPFQPNGSVQSPDCGHVSKFRTLDSRLNFYFRVSGTRLSQLLDANLRKAFNPSLECQVSYPIKALEF